MDKGNMVYTYKRILFGHQEKEILLFGTTWMDLEDILLHEIRQTEKDLHEESKTSKLIETENRRVVAGAAGREGGGAVFWWVYSFSFAR